MERIGKHRLQGRIGRGGMGSVYKAHDPILDRSVALKVIAADFNANDEMRARFLREAQAAARLTHPNIVTVYDLGEADGYVFIAMELLEGEELRQLIARRPVLDLADKLSLMIQLCEGLGYAHQRGIVHRDIKPGNLFVLPDGHLKILDFGTARVSTSTGSLTRRGELVGTLQYMAPERLREGGDARADIFSVGVVLYELLTYRTPFAASDMLQLIEQLRDYDPPPPSRLDPSLPAEIDRIVARALEKEPDRRFASLVEMRVALEAVRRRDVDGTDRLRAEVGGLIREMDELERAVATRLGAESAPSSEALRVTARTPRHVLIGMRDEVATRTAHARALLARSPEHDAVLDRDTEATKIFLPEAAACADPAGADPAGPSAARRADADIASSTVPETAATDGVRADDRVGSEPAVEPETAGAWRPPLFDRARSVVGRVIRRPLRVGRGHGAAAAVAALVLVALAIGLLTGPHADSHREQLRTLEDSVRAARERAAGAEAAALASARFTEGDTRAGTAGRLAAEGQTEAATQAYREAVEHYARAERQAQAKREERQAANAARAAMLAAKGPGAAGTAEFATALDRERRGDEMYDARDFAAAAVIFTEAASLYTKATAVARASPPAVVPTSVAPATRDVRAEIRAALQTYVRAIQTKDLALLRRVRSGLSDDEIRRWARSFEIMRSRQVDLEVHDIAVRDDTAQVTGRRADTIVLHDGQRMSTESRFVYKLQRRPDGWILNELQEMRATPAAGR